MKVFILSKIFVTKWFFERLIGYKVKCVFPDNARIETGHL